MPKTPRSLVLVYGLGALGQACLQRLLAFDVRLCCLDRGLAERHCIESCPVDVIQATPLRRHRL